jgi:hypothetical protein
VKPEVLSLNPILLVESWDAPAYRKAYPHVGLLKMSERDRGIAYARNVALDWARRQGRSHCWVMDDDLTDFTVRHKRSDGKWTRTPCDAAFALATAEAQLADSPPVALAGITAAWNRKRPERITYSENVACCIRYDLFRLGDLRYRECLRLGEDTDMALQAITRNKGTCRLNDFDYQTPFWGTNTGGLQEEYEDTDLKAEQVQKLVQYWPGIVKARPGATHYDIDWDALAGRQTAPDPLPQRLDAHRGPVGAGARRSMRREARDDTPRGAPGE